MTLSSPDGDKPSRKRTKLKFVPLKVKKSSAKPAVSTTPPASSRTLNLRWPWPPHMPPLCGTFQRERLLAPTPGAAVDIGDNLYSRLTAVDIGDNLYSRLAVSCNLAELARHAALAAIILRRSAFGTYDSIVLTVRADGTDIPTAEEYAILELACRTPSTVYTAGTRPLLRSLMSHYVDLYSLTLNLRSYYPHTRFTTR